MRDIPSKNPSVVLCLLLASSASVHAQPSAAKTAAYTRPNIVLIVLDTVRADAVGFSRLRKGVKTPFLDSWAREALVFTHALSPADSTPGSHFSMFTGYPARALETTADVPEISVIAQLNAAGYDTIGLSANALVDPHLMQSVRPFQTFVSAPYVSAVPLRPRQYKTLLHYGLSSHFHFQGVETNLASALSSAEEINARAEELLSTCRGPSAESRPLFFFVNFLDAHDPYTAPAPFAPSAEDLWAHWPVNGDLRSGPKNGDEPRGDHGVPEWRHASRYSAESLRFLRSLYDREVQYLDSQLAVLFATLRRHGILRNAVVAITSDHGEAFGEQGYLVHHLEFFGIHISELYRVPLAIRGYGLRLKPEKPLDGATNTTSLADSIRAWAGLPRGLGPELDPIASVRAPRTPMPPTGPAAAVRTMPPSTAPKEQASSEARTPEQRERDEELVRRLRSLGYLK